MKSALLSLLFCLLSLAGGTQNSPKLKSFELKKMYIDNKLNIDNLTDHNLIYNENSCVFFIKGLFLIKYDLESNMPIDSLNFSLLNAKWDYSNKKILLCSDLFGNICIISYLFDYFRSEGGFISILTFDKNLEVKNIKKIKKNNKVDLNFDVQYFSCEKGCYFFYSIFHNAFYEVCSKYFKYNSDAFFDFYNGNMYCRSYLDSMLVKKSIITTNENIVIPANNDVYLLSEDISKNYSLMRMSDLQIIAIAKKEETPLLSGIYIYKKGFYWFTNENLYYVEY